MYSLVRARVLPKTLAAQWCDADLVGTVVATIFSTYREVFLEVTADGLEGSVYVDLKQLQAEYATYANTLGVLLQVLGNRTLDTVPQLPDGLIDYVKYSDAIRVGYKARYASHGVVYPDSYPKEALLDLTLTRPNTATDLSLLHDYCLVSVNGYYHRTDTDGSQLWVVDGASSVRRLNRNHVGITSFLDIGKLTKLSLTDDMIAVAPSYSQLKDKIQLTLPGDFTAPSVMLVLAGYLVLPEDGVFFPSGEKTWILDLSRLPYLERLMEGRLFIDLKDLELPESDLDPSTVNLETVWSDAVIRRYLKLSQSFVVGVDREHLFYNKRTLRQFNEPGLFSSYQEPMYPLLVGYGRTAEYWKRLEDGYWAVTCQDNYLRNYLFNQVAESLLVNAVDQLDGSLPSFISQGALLELGAYGAKD